MSEEKYYTHSGPIHATGVLTMLGIGIIACAFYSIVYTYLIYYCPFIYFNFFFTVFFGTALGKTIVYAGKWGKVRNRFLSILLSSFFSLFALYCSWIVWIFMLLEKKQTFVDPVEILDFMGVIADQGAWSIGSFTPTGGILYLIWTIEAFLVIGFAINATISAYGHTAYCNRCKMFAEEQKPIGPLSPIPDPESFKAELEQKNFSTLGSLKRIFKNPEYFSVVELSTCNYCNDLYLLTVKMVSNTKKQDGSIEYDEYVVVRNMYIGEHEYEALTNFWKIKKPRPHLEHGFL